jgi:hypothetical protein
MIEKYIPKSSLVGQDLGDMLSKVGTIEIDRSKNPNENKELVND